MFSRSRSAVSCISFIFALSATILLLAIRVFAQAPGGFIEKSYSTATRPRLSASQIQSFVAPSRGMFTFPAPYNTIGIRLTNASDCVGSTDCVNYVGYSYWRNMNNHVGSDAMLIFVGLDRARGGAGPTLFQYN